MKTRPGVEGGHATVLVPARRHRWLAFVLLILTLGLLAYAWWGWQRLGK